MSYFLKILFVSAFIAGNMWAASLSLTPTDQTTSHLSQKKRNNNVTRGAILQAIMNHKNDDLRRMVETNPDLDPRFVDIMGHRAVLFRNPQAVDVLMQVYGTIAKSSRSFVREDCIRAQGKLTDAVARESAFLGDKQVVEDLFKKYPQHKISWLGDFLIGAAEGGHQSIVDFVLKHIPEIMKNKHAKSLFLICCKTAMCEALEGYNSQIAIQISKLSGPDFLIDPTHAIQIALYMKDRQFIGFAKRSFPQEYQRALHERNNPYDTSSEFREGGSLYPKN